VGLRGAQAMMPNDLSGGMTRRVALARAIATDPELMMYDEPFAGLDPISLGVIGNLIRRLNDASGATSIVVTHDIEQALEISDRVALLTHGKLRFVGTPAEFRMSVDPVVRAFADRQAAAQAALQLVERGESPEEIEEDP